MNTYLTRIYDFIFRFACDFVTVIETVVVCPNVQSCNLTLQILFMLEPFR